jgi:hypothetical protein
MHDRAVKAVKLCSVTSCIVNHNSPFFLCLGYCGEYGAFVFRSAQRKSTTTRYNN